MKGITKEPQKINKRTIEETKGIMKKRNKKTMKRREIKGKKMKEKPEHPPIEKKRKKTVNIILKEK